MERNVKNLLGLASLSAGMALAACGAPPPAAPAPAQESAPVAGSEAAQSQPAEETAPQAAEAGSQSAETCAASLTPAQTEGPYYTPGSPERASLLEDDPAGTPLVLAGRVMDPACQPIAGAMVDFWQTDSAGNYDNAGYGMRGHVLTGADGSYQFLTVIPGQYPGRTAHIHVKVFDPDGRELLTTQIYLRGLSEQVPDGIYDPALLATDLDPDAQGRRQVGFDFVVRG